MTMAGQPLARAEYRLNPVSILLAARFQYPPEYPKSGLVTAPGNYRLTRYTSRWVEI